MKLAKKLLACLMVLAIALSCAAMAFAQSGEPAVKLAYDEDDDILSLNFVDAVGLKSWDLTITYETKAFDGVDSADAGADAAEVANTKDNTVNVSDGINAETAGTILFAGYFKESLWTAEEFAANAKKNKTVNVNATDFEAILFYMVEQDDLDLTKTSTTIKVEGSYSMSDDSKVNVSDTLVIGKSGEGETTTAQAPETTTAQAPETTTAQAPETTTAQAPETTTAAPIVVTTTKETEETTAGPIVRPTTDADHSNIVVRPTDNKGRPVADKDASELPGPCHDKHIKTGDSAVLAAAAGVILLAGAAFVVSKKRK